MRPVLAALALALAAVACTTTPSAAPDGPPVPLALWPGRALPTETFDRAAALEGVVALGRIGSGTLNLTAVRGATRSLPARRPGAILPVSVIAIDHRPLVRTGAAPDLAEPLSRGEAIITSTEARLRGMEAGDALRLDGETTSWFKVGAVVPDDDLINVEIVLPLRAAASLGLPTNRALTLAVRPGAVERVREGLRALLGENPALIGSVQELRARAQSLLPIARIKEVFGEFTFVPVDGYRFRIDPAWVERNVVEVRLPVVGLVKCHRTLLPQLTGAMRELSAMGLEELVRSEDGCWSARFQFGNRASLSRHAFGAAIDINFADNRYGAAPTQDPRLVEVMERWGFTWGGRWMVPDGMHFEYFRALARTPE